MSTEIHHTPFAAFACIDTLCVLVDQTSSLPDRPRSGSIPAPVPSVRVKRSRAPTLVGGASLAPIPSEAVPSTFEQTDAEAEAAGSTNNSIGRRRRGTLTERLFQQQQDSYNSISEDENGLVGRARSSSRVSRQSSEAGRNPVEVVIPEKAQSDITRKRSRTSVSRNRSLWAGDDDDHHHDEEVQVVSACVAHYVEIITNR